MGVGTGMGRVGWSEGIDLMAAFSVHLQAFSLFFFFPALFFILGRGPRWVFRGFGWQGSIAALGHRWC